MTSSGSQRYRVFYNKQTILITVDGGGHDGALRALRAWCKLLDLDAPESLVEVKIAQGEYTGQRAWEWRHPKPQGGWLQAIEDPAPEPCGTAKTGNERNVQILIDALDEYNMEGERLVLQPAFLIAVGICGPGGSAPHHLLWLVNHGWLTERLSWIDMDGQPQDVVRKVGACGRPFYFLKDDAKPDGLGLQVDSCNVKMLFLTTTKLDELRKE